jgi:hypothetical protein
MRSYLTIAKGNKKGPNGHQYTSRPYNSYQTAMKTANLEEQARSLSQSTNLPASYALRSRGNSSWIDRGAVQDPCQASG